MEKNLWKGSLYLFIAALLWGGMYVDCKYVLAQIPTFTTLWLRYLIATICLFVILLRQNNKTIHLRDVPFMIWLAFIGYLVANAAGLYGTYLSTAHMGALISSLSPVFTMIAAFFILKEKLSFQKIVSFVIAIIGVFIVLGFEKNQGQSQFWGIIILLLGATSWGMYSVYVKKAAVKYSAIVITTYSTLVALLMTTPFMLREFNTKFLSIIVKPDIGISLLFLGIFATAMAFYLWNKGIELMDASVGSTFYFFVPIVSSVFGWLLLDEQLSWNFFLGGLLIFLGAGYVSLSGKPSKKSLKTENSIERQGVV
jgi:drug/metabolite transporter (DMT)-like permease